jgi:hypothetical protein
MCVDRSVASRACQVLPLTVRNVLTVGISVALGESEVNNEDLVLCLIVAANQKVVWFDISVNDPFLVDFLNSLDL